MWNNDNFGIYSCCIGYTRWINTAIYRWFARYSTNVDSQYDGQREDFAAVNVLVGYCVLT